MRSLRNAVNETIYQASGAVIGVLAIAFLAAAAPLYLVRYKPLIWLAFLMPFPIAFVIDAKLRRRIRCPQCDGSLQALVRLGQFGRGFALSMRLDPEILECPQCGVDFDRTRAPDRTSTPPFRVAKALLLFAAAVLLPLATSVAVIAVYGEPVITVHNAGAVPLSLVYVRGSGFDHPIGSIAPGEAAHVVVRPQGESGLAAAWTAEGRDFQREELGYLLRFGGWCITLVIHGEQLSVREQRQFCPSLTRLTRNRR